MPNTRPEKGIIRTVKEQKIKNRTYPVPKQIEVPFLFNPGEITVARQNDWKTPDSRKHSSSKSLEFGGGQPLQITLQLFFDTYEIHSPRQLQGRAPDVREYTDRLQEMMQPQDRLGPDKGGWPPQVELVWGNLQRGWRFPCYITSMTQKFLLFTPDGVPVRATVDLTLKSDHTSTFPKQNPTSGGEGDERVRLVKPGERLDLIAYEEYGDSTLWRLIADANGLASLRDLRAGQRLAIPNRT
jgi:hypothetical protein